jgi:thiol-disulfide isomerase/thioredoxin
MRKGILFFVLTIIFLSLAVFLIKALLMQKNSDNDGGDGEENNQNAIEATETPSYYKNYSKEDYDKALNEKRVLVLYFTSNWCQKCIEQDTINTLSFEELNKEGAIGLKIHILDSETTTETDALSQKFDVTKEQSFVILDKDGAVYFKHTGVLEKDQLKQKILELR